MAIVNAKVGARASYTVVQGMELELALRWLALVPVEVACAPCTIRRLHTCAIRRLHHVQYVDCTQVQYVDYKCALDALMVKDTWNVDRLVPREPLTQLV